MSNASLIQQEGADEAWGPMTHADLLLNMNGLYTMILKMIQMIANLPSANIAEPKKRRGRNMVLLERRQRFIAQYTNACLPYLRSMRSKVEKIMELEAEGKDAAELRKELPTAEQLESKVRVVRRAFLKRATAHPNCGSAGKTLSLSLANDDTDRLAKARIIWDADGRPLKADGTPDLRSKRYHTMNVKFIHPKVPKEAPKPKKEPAAPKITPIQDAIVDAVNKAHEAENELKELRERNARWTLHAAEKLEAHKEAVLRRGACHLRFRNWKEQGKRICNLCNHIKNSDKNLTPEELKALSKTHNNHLTKKKKKKPRSTRTPKAPDMSEPLPDEYYDNPHAWAVKNQVMLNDQLQPLFTKKDFEMTRNDPDAKEALGYIVGTPEYMERRQRKMAELLMNAKQAILDAANKEAEGKKLENTAHMVKRKKRVIPSTRALKA